MCEGNLDVISMYQAGFKNAVATCGTAITDSHARNIANLGFKRSFLHMTAMPQDRKLPQER